MVVTSDLSRVKARMNDVLFHVTSKMDNTSLEVFSQVPHVWEQVKKYSTDQEWWYLRTQHLLGSELKRRECENWSAIYSVLTTLDLTSGFVRTIQVGVIREVLLEVSKYSPIDQVLSTEFIKTMTGDDTRTVRILY